VSGGDQLALHQLLILPRAIALTLGAGLLVLAFEALCERKHR
jgi:hypothetical protein